MADAHLNRIELRAFADGELSPAACERTARHLADCALCADELAKLTPIFGMGLRIDVDDGPTSDDQLAAVRTIAAQTGYTVGRLLGRGGMGQVYSAVGRDGRKVAIKVVHSKFAADPAGIRALMHREAQTLRMLDHPNVARCFDYHLLDDNPVLVMELVEGVSLYKRINDGTAMSVAEAVGFARQLLFAVGHLAEYGVIHRDIKPENCMIVERTGLLKLVDFGIAKDTEAGWRTTTRIIRGTPQYMSPEQVTRPRSVDSRSDLYAVGCVLFHLLVGRPPFQGEQNAVFFGHAALKPVIPAQARVPKALMRVVLKLLAKSPCHRYATAAEAIAALDFAVVARPRRRLIAAALTTLTVAASAAFVAFALPTADSAPTIDTVASISKPLPPPDDGILTVTELTPAFFGSPRWTDYTVTVEMMPGGTGGGSLYFRSTAENRSARLCLGILKDRYAVLQRLSPGLPPRAESEPLDCRLTPDAWVAITLTVQDRTVTASINGKPLNLVRPGFDGLNGSGGIGFTAEADSVCRFRNVSVVANGTVLLSSFSEAP